MAIVWLVSLTYNAGIGMAYGVYEKTMYVVLALTIFNLIATKYFSAIPKCVIVSFAVIFLLSAYTTYAYERNLLSYVWVYLLTCLLSLLPVEKTQMKLVSIMYGLLGMAVLVVRNFGGAFNGWNSNAIAMIAFFSFAVMIAAFNRTDNNLTVIFLVLYTAAYFVLTEVLGSRSGFIFSLIMILGVFDLISFRRWFKKDWILLITLLSPLIIAVLIAAVSKLPFIADLETWSLETTGKPLFNGRDRIWIMGFERFFDHPFVGVGSFHVYNWHNSAVTLLVGSGMLGYLTCIWALYKVIKYAKDYIDDSLVFGFMLGFLVIWVQQAFELGLIGNQVNLIPYALIGLMLGRIKTLQKEGLEGGQIKKTISDSNIREN